MIALQFITTHSREARKEYDTDSLRDALIEFVKDGFKDPAETGTDESNGPAKWIFAVVIERGDSTYDADELVDQFHDLAAMQLARSLPR